MCLVNVQRWERSVQDEEDSLERCKQAETKHRTDIENDKQRIETLKSEKQEKKRIVDQMEEDTAKARRDVAALAKEIHNINYVVSSIDTKIETKKNERHNLLIQCKMDDIKIPMLNGANLDELSTTHGGNGQNETTNTTTGGGDYSTRDSS